MTIYSKNPYFSVAPISVSALPHSRARQGHRPKKGLTVRFMSTFLPYLQVALTVGAAHLGFSSRPGIVLQCPAEKLHPVFFFALPPPPAYSF